MGRLTSVGMDWVYRGEYLALADQIERMFAVPARDVVDVARAFDIVDAAILALGPLDSL